MKLSPFKIYMFLKFIFYSRLIGENYDVISLSNLISLFFLSKQTHFKWMSFVHTFFFVFYFWIFEYWWYCFKKKNIELNFWLLLCLILDLEWSFSTIKCIIYIQLFFTNLISKAFFQRHLKQDFSRVDLI